jgi:hypothetical protein
MCPFFLLKPVCHNVSLLLVEASLIPDLQEPCIGIALPGHCVLLSVEINHEIQGTSKEIVEDDQSQEPLLDQASNPIRVESTYMTHKPPDSRVEESKDVEP